VPETSKTKFSVGRNRKDRQATGTQGAISTVSELPIKSLLALDVECSDPEKTQ
jgi:hypothetical protein